MGKNAGDHALVLDRVDKRHRSRAPMAEQDLHAPGPPHQDGPREPAFAGGVVGASEVNTKRRARLRIDDARSRERPFSNGRHTISLTPNEFLSRLCTLIPPPRVHQTRYYGIFAPRAQAPL